MLFNPAARLSTAVILLRHSMTSADIAVREFRTLAHLSSAALRHEEISTAMVLLITCSLIPSAERQPYGICMTTSLSAAAMHRVFRLGGQQLMWPTSMVMVTRIMR